MTPPTAAELAAARAEGVPWKELTARYGLNRVRLWEILTGRARPRVVKDVVPTSCGLPSPAPLGEAVALLAAESPNG